MQSGESRESADEDDAAVLVLGADALGAALGAAAALAARVAFDFGIFFTMRFLSAG